ncbi:MAG: PhnD/SsuA/transferrin family substrate-binding protein [Bauldia litoralis]|uniref:PhnD/SsuA/transferrin family substrate-binding protein n=1 Tax=Bauldia litoralis TaxID=665467 RepID=UPI0032987CE2
MGTTMRINTIIAAGALALTAAVMPASAETYKLAITDVEGLERLQTEWGAFKAAMEAATGDTFEFYPVSNRTAAAESLRAKRVDFVVTGPAEYVVINKLTNATTVVGLSRPDYFCAWVVMADSAVVRPADLKGTEVAMDDIGSTSGHLCPSQLLADYGVDPLNDLKGVVHTTRAVAHEALKRGDVAAIGVNYMSWVNGIRGKDDSVPPGSFRVIARSGDLPNDLMVAGSHGDPAAVDAIRAALVGDKAAIVEAIVSVGGENDKYRGMDIVAIEDKAYDPVRAMYITIGHPEFSDFVGE